MDVDDYLKEIDKTAKFCALNNITAHDYLEKKITENVELFRDFVSFARQLITPKEYDRYSWILETGLFVKLDSDSRVALMVFASQVSSILKISTLTDRFRPYHTDQALFSLDPGILDYIRVKESGGRDNELLDESMFNNIRDSEVFERNGIYYQLEPFLNSAIYTISKTSFPNSKFFIRLNPLFASTSKPLFMINEEVLRPANPHWWRKLNIHRRHKEGASYKLFPKEPTKDDYQDYWEYHALGIRRLDVIAKRNGNGNLSMMIEELSDREIESGYTIGRCIHLDTDDPIGTEFSHSVVNHMDLAINVYSGHDSDSRYQTNLAEGGKVTDATFRTHLIRMENVPLKFVIVLAHLFFDSNSLVAEWFCDQFQRKESASIS